MPGSAELYVFFGLIASGKSTLAEAWASSRLASYYNSDRVRKQIAGIAPEESRKEAVGQGIYSKEFSRKTYDALLQSAENDLTRGISVVLDASYQNRLERKKVRELATDLRVRVYFVFCICDEQELKRRMELRTLDPGAVSDGRWEIYLQQRESFEPPDELNAEELIIINTEKPVEQLVKDLKDMIEE